MLRKLLGVAIAIAVIGVLAMPFGREVYYRYEVWRHLDGVGDQGRRAAFGEWQGGAREFQAQLRAQCVQTYGTGAPECARFRTSGD
jgi:hypothetical protein